MMRFARTIALATLAAAAVSPALAQDARPWPQCAHAPRCAYGSAATCTMQGTCVIPTKRPHRGCLQYSCVKQPKKLGRPVRPDQNIDYGGTPSTSKGTLIK